MLFLLLEINQCLNSFLKNKEYDLYVEKIIFSTDLRLAGTMDVLVRLHESDEYIQKALKIIDSLGSEGSKAMVFNCAGILFKERNRYKDAISYLEKALEIQVHLEDQLMEAKILNNLGHCFITLGHVLSLLSLSPLSVISVICV